MKFRNGNKSFPPHGAARVTALSKAAPKRLKRQIPLPDDLSGTGEFIFRMSYSSAKTRPSEIFSNSFIAL